MMEGRTTSKENRRQRSNESGQALVVFIVFIFGLIATMGLVLDGGNIYLQRRGMQNAADAGALAGAQVLALGGTTAEAEAVARNRALTSASMTRARRWRSALWRTSPPQ
jgi:uncharacterized membrane protein